MQEQRLTARLEKVWDHASRENPPPEFAHFNRATIDDIWNNCAVLMMQPGGSPGNYTYQFQHVGNNISQMLGGVHNGSYFSAKMTKSGGLGILKRIDEAFASMRPLYDDGKFVNNRSKVVKYRSCLLPFGSNASGISHVLVGLSWREF